MSGDEIVTLLGAIGIAQNAAGGGYRGLNQNWESCEEMHDSYVKRFVSAEGFGMSRMMPPRSPAMVMPFATVERSTHVL